VTVRHGDTDAVADGVGSFTSRSAAMGGSAVAKAAAEALEHGTGRARFASDQTFTSGAYAARGEVSRATGQVRVTKLVAVDDAGTILNPPLARGQVAGGAVQGLGAVLTEAVAEDPLDYALLTAVEAGALVSEFVESPSPLNPLGAKGISESGTIGTPAAVANALADALGRHVDPPFSAEKVWRVLR
jgi:carbon-monoxide dehydrogenase large subunit